MPSEKITAMPSWGGAQVGTDLITGVDLSQAAALQNVKSTLDDFFGNVPSPTSIRRPAATGAPSRAFQIITPADTALTASTENILNQIGGNASAATVTRQFATGALTTQRENVVVHPTYGFVGASTMTVGATFSITNAPAAGTNATITQPLAFWIQGGLSRFDGDIVGADTNDRARIRVDASGVSFPSTLFLYHPTGQPTQLAAANFFQTNIGYPSTTGRDMGIQLSTDTTGSYAMFAGFGALATIFGNQNNTNPIIFGINNVFQGQINNGSLWYMGNGDLNASPVTAVVNGTGASGNNVAGANLDLAGGRATGNAEPGFVAVRYPLRGSSGTTIQSLSTNRYPVVTNMFRAGGTVTIASSTTETSLFATAASGSTRTIEAGMARQWQAYHIVINGFFSTTGTPTARIRLTVAGTQILDTGAIAFTTAALNTRFRIEAYMWIESIGATATVSCTPFRFDYPDSTAFANNSAMRSLFGGGAGTINLTAAAAIDVLWTWGTNSASNTISTNQQSINIIG